MNKKSDADDSIAGPSSAACMISDRVNDSSSDSTFIIPAAKQVWRQSFRQSWLEDPYFKPWLQQADDPHKAKCAVCSIFLRAKKSDLHQHVYTETHIMNIQQKAGASISVPSNVTSSSSDTVNDSSSAGSFTCPPSKKPKTAKTLNMKQSFRQAWLEDPYFKPWLQQADDPHKAKCAVCSIFLRAKKSDLHQHVYNETHITNIQQKAGASISVPSSVTSSSSDTANDSSSDSTFIIPAAKQVRRQSFRQAWLEDPDFKPWLQADDPYKAKCAVCSTFLSAGKSRIQDHASSEAHIANMLHQKEALTSTVKRTFADNVKEAEITICMDAIEHDRSFRSYCHFIKILQKALPDPNVLVHMSLDRTKMTAIAKNVINKSIIIESTQRLQSKFFSVLIDETTDISDTKILCFLIRYVEKAQIYTYLLDLVELSDAKAENLYTCLLYSLNKYNLSLTNMVGVCVDNANGMVGANNSLTSRLLAANAEICVFPCICHSMHLVASHACKCLPSFVGELLHSIYSYFSRSPKRQIQLQFTQLMMGLREQKVLQPSVTRWLAASEWLKRILTQWQALYSIFALEVIENETVKDIFTFMNCPFTKAYFHFLDYALDNIIKFNKLFQTSKVIVHCLVSACIDLLRTFAGNFIKEQYFRRSDLHEIDVDNEDNLMPLETIYLGVKCKDTINEIRNRNCEADNERIIQFYTHAKQFYQCAFKQIVKRMPFNEQFLHSLDFLHPDVALNLSRHRENQLDDILNKYNSKFDREAVANEWYALACYSSENDKTKLLALSVTEFWHHISSVRDILDEYMFENISKLAQLCFSLPHSNADVERYFSLVTKIKTSDQNRLNTDTISALARVKLDLNNKKANCSNFEITDTMLKLFNEHMYVEDETSKQVAGTLHAEEPDE